MISYSTYISLSVFLQLFECVTLLFIFLSVCIFFSMLIKETKRENNKQNTKQIENNIEKRSLKNGDNNISFF